MVLWSQSKKEWYYDHCLAWSDSQKRPAAHAMNIFFSLFLRFPLWKYKLKEHVLSKKKKESFLSRVMKVK